MSQLPYSDTSVAVSKSTGSIKTLLSDRAGCQSVLETTSDGKTQIVGLKDGLTYLFEFDINHIAKQLYTTSPTKKGLEKAERVGWRIIWHEVKHMATCVQYGLFPMERAFANHLVSVDKTGKLEYFGDIAAEAVKSGKISNGNIAQALLPQNTGGSR